MPNMTTAIVKNNQTVYDLALEQYGTCEAIGELLNNNPDLRNDSEALAAQGIDGVKDPALYLYIALQPGLQVVIDNDSPLMECGIVKELSTEITTYERFR